MRSDTLRSIPATLALLAIAACSGEMPAEWPSKPVTVIVPFGAGTGTDLAARLIAPLLAERWETPVVIDNRPGGDSVIGLQAFVARGDDHTLLFAPTGSMTLVPLLHERLGFSPAEDLVPIAAATEVTLAIASSSSMSVSSLADLVALARARPGEYRWAAAPGLPELIFSAFLALERLEMTNVAYRDIPTALRDLAAGRIHVMIASVATISPQLPSGDVRLIAVMNSERSAVAPQVPTAREAGYPGLTIDGQWGFFGPRGMPGERRLRVAGDIRHATSDAELVARLAGMGLVAVGDTGEDFSAAIARQRQQITRIARIVGLKGADHVRVP